MSGIETVSFPAGAVIFKENEKPDGVYFILSGGVEISRSEAGQKISLARLGPDAVFGEMALIDSQPRSATVTTIAPTECMKGTADNFAILLSNVDPVIRNAMQQIVTIIRAKNKTRKTKMTPNDTAMLNSLKAQAMQIRQQLLSNTVLIEKLKTLDPFLNGVFNSLLKLLVA
ncbi:MAG: cyclic nucleotide-binding protein [Rickettsiaceae bacterium]|jgi:CRP-like cAMP-binding protein|nr:cyclic nucleotide-binding protein [Rickettsiaceae bacterium]